ncbi:DUF3168 domain-containing protein [Mesorhizobium retamae]|uniref:DUF3168 domain-containing protein n=1 Tax=Mesorhizobium retamae TaxID=2912854 RepID=UPI003CCFE5B0
MDSLEELQRLLYATLKADTAVMAIAGGVYDNVPTNPYAGKTAYISFGPVDTNEDDAECINGLTITVQIDIWSSAVGAVETKKLVGAVRKALHRKALTLTDNALVDIWVTVTRIIPDPAGIDHGIVTVSCMIEEPA